MRCINSWTVTLPGIDARSGHPLVGKTSQLLSARRKAFDSHARAVVSGSGGGRGHVPVRGAAGDASGSQPARPLRTDVRRSDAGGSMLLPDSLKATLRGRGAPQARGRRHPAERQLHYQPGPSPLLGGFSADPRRSVRRGPGGPVQSGPHRVLSAAGAGLFRGAFRLSAGSAFRAWPRAGIIQLTSSSM